VELQNPRKEARRDLSGAHDRTPDIIASLYPGWVCFLEFAQEVAAIAEEELGELAKMGWQALVEAGKLQSQHQSSEDMVNLFLRLLASTLSSGQAHLEDFKTNGEPPEAVSWGWRSKANGQGTEGHVPQGDCIGWVDSMDIYLEPESTFAAVQKLARDQGTSLSVTSQTLWSRLKERGILSSTEPGHNTVRRSINGKRPHVLHVKKETLGWVTSQVSEESSPISDHNVVPLKQKTNQR
jgi:hypothetical protein